MLNTSTSRLAGLARAALRLIRSPLLIVVAALILRFALAGNFVGWMTANGKGDPYSSNEPSHIAAHIARGEGFSSPYDGILLMPSAQQPPLYPLFISGIFKITGVFSLASLWTLVGFNCVLGSLVCFLIYRVGKRWFSPLAGVSAAWIWALLPAIAATDLNLSHYLLSTVFVLGWLCLLPRKYKIGQKQSFLLGATLGIGMLMNSVLVLLYPASARWFLQSKRHVLFSLLAVGLIVSPWMLRNYLTMGHFYPGLRDSFGQALYVGNHRGMENTRGCAWNLCGGTYDYSDDGDDLRQFAARGEGGFMQWKLTQSIDYIRSSPREFLARSSKRALAFWLLPYPLFYLPVVLLSWVYILRSNPLRFFLVTLFALYPFAYYVTEVVWATSYRHPIEPLVLLSAVSMVLSLFGRVTQGSQRTVDSEFSLSPAICS